MDALQMIGTLCLACLALLVLQAACVALAIAVCGLPDPDSWPNNDDYPDEPYMW